jgi:hypothetical protein
MDELREAQTELDELDREREDEAREQREAFADGRTTTYDPDGTE